MFDLEGSGYTILTKENCKWCEKAKALLPDAKRIRCDEFIETPDKKQMFFEKVDSLSGATPRTFPMVFHNGKYVGGYTCVAHMVHNQLTFEDVDF